MRLGDFLSLSDLPLDSESKVEVYNEVHKNALH